MKLRKTGAFLLSAAMTLSAAMCSLPYFTINAAAASVAAGSNDKKEKSGRDFLGMTLDYCAAMNESEYIPESWAAFQSALSEAKAVYAKEGQLDSVYTEARAALEKVKCAMLFAQTGTAENPLPYRELTKEQLLFEMGVGINLGNTMDGHSGFSPGETSWQSVRTTKNYITALHDAGFNTVRIPVTWGSTIDYKTYEIREDWINRVQEIVDYCISQDMYVIINIHHDGAEQSGWLRVAAEDIDAVYEKFECVWRNIAERFKDYDEHLIFESMNEITCMKDDLKNSREAIDKDTPVIVNLNQIFVNVVRSTGSNNEKRWLAAVAHYANTGNHEDFVLPADTNAENSHIMFAAHIYKANTNTTWTYDEIYQVVNNLKIMADKFDVPMYLGEYGNRTKEQEGTESGYNDTARAYFSEIVHRACQTAEVVPVVWDQGYGTKGKYETGLFTYWDRELCVPLFKTITDAMLRGTYIENSAMNDSWDYTDVVENPEIIPIKSITLSHSKVEMTIGDNFTVTAQTSPENSNDVVLWSTDDDTVATVSRGIIRGRGIGRTTVRAYTQNGTVEKEIVVIVKAKTDSAGVVNAPQEIRIDPGKSQLIGASASDGTGSLTYKSSNPNVISVSPVGRIFAIGSGVSYVTITSHSGSSTAVKVVSGIPSSDDITLTAVKSSVSVDAVGDTAVLQVKTQPGAIVTFVPENSGIAAVNAATAMVAGESGNISVKLTAMSVGTTTVTAYSESGSTAVFELTVLHETPTTPVIILLSVIIVAAAAGCVIVFIVKKKRADRKSEGEHNE